jgi:hypothetical protein
MEDWLRIFSGRQIGHTSLPLQKTKLPRLVLPNFYLQHIMLSSDSQLINARDLEVMKTYVADTPLNSASITPKKDFVILGGGQAAMDVTTTSTRQGKFEARFYHKIFEEEIGRVRGHFGPLSMFASQSI